VLSIRRPEGRPFAFVSFESFAAADKAIEELTDQELNGKVPRLGLSRPRRTGGGGSAQSPTESDCIFIGNLACSTEEEDIEEFVDQVGDWTEVRKPPGKPFAFVEFESNEAAAKAVAELNGKELNGMALRVNLSRPRNKPEDAPLLEDTKPLGTFLNEDNVDRAVKLRGPPFRTTAQ